MAHLRFLFGSWPPCSPAAGASAHHFERGRYNTASGAIKNIDCNMAPLVITAACVVSVRRFAWTVYHGLGGSSVIPNTKLPICHNMYATLENFRKFSTLFYSSFICYSCGPYLTVFRQTIQSCACCCGYWVLSPCSHCKDQSSSSFTLPSILMPYSPQTRQSIVSESMGVGVRVASLPGSLCNVNTKKYKYDYSLSNFFTSASGSLNFSV